VNAALIAGNPPQRRVEKLREFWEAVNAKNYEGIAKDFEFSRRTMKEHWAAGYEDVVRSISHPEVMQRPDKMEGVRTFDWAHHGQK
jgi:hypothetical protein